MYKKTTVKNRVDLAMFVLLYRNFNAPCVIPMKMGIQDERFFRYPIKAFGYDKVLGVFCPKKKKKPDRF